MQDAGAEASRCAAVTTAELETALRQAEALHERVSEEEAAHANTKEEWGAERVHKQQAEAELLQQVREGEVALQESVQRVEQLAQEVDRLKCELAVAQEQAVQRSCEIDGAKQELATAQERAAKLEAESSVQQQRLEVEQGRLDQSEAARSRADEQLKAMEEQLHAMEQSSSAAEKAALKQLEEVQLKLASADVRQSEFETAHAAAEKQAVRVAQLENELSMLQREMEATRAGQQTLLESKDTLVQRLQHDNNGLQHRLEEAQREHKAAEARWEQQLHEAHAELRKQEKMAAEVEAAANRSQERVLQLEGEVAGLRAQIEKAAAEQRSLEVATDERLLALQREMQDGRLPRSVCDVTSQTEKVVQGNGRWRLCEAANNEDLSKSELDELQRELLTAVLDRASVEQQLVEMQQRHEDEARRGLVGGAESGGIDGNEPFEVALERSVREIQLQQRINESVTELDTLRSELVAAKDEVAAMRHVLQQVEVGLGECARLEQATTGLALVAHNEMKVLSHKRSLNQRDTVMPYCLRRCSDATIFPAITI